MEKIESIDCDTVDIVTYTANQISLAKGHTITYKRDEVEIILQSVRLVNSLSGVRNEVLSEKKI